MPTLQQQAARMTCEAWEGQMRTAEFVPPEKRDWVSQGEAHPLHDILAECASSRAGGILFFWGTRRFRPPSRGIRAREGEVEADAARGHGDALK